MSEPTLADVIQMMKDMQADIAGLKEKSDTSSSSGGRTDAHRDLDRPPKFQKLDFPRYDGKSDPLLFVNRCESYFRQQRTMGEERVWMASYNLEGIAQHWFIQLQDDEGMPPWGRFKELLQLRFGPALRSAPLFELAECRRTGSVEDYSNRFQELLSRAGRLDKSQRVQLFTGGLLPPLSHAVRIHNPETLAAAMSLARQVEIMELDRQPPTPARPASRGLLPASKHALPAPQQQLALLAPPMGAPQGRDEGNNRRLSMEEMVDRRRQGLCFNCNEKYTRGHNRFCRRIFFIDGVEVDDAIDTTETAGIDAPCFSLQAVAGVATADTMQITVTLGPVSLVALLDSGSTHNFISATAAHRSGLPIQRRPRLTAMVANGERITCAGVLRNAPLHVDGEAFPTDLFVMPLAGYDVVLGTRWLDALGPIVWDLAVRRMAFQQRGRSTTWAGAPGNKGPAVRTTTAGDTLLEALLDAFEGSSRLLRACPPSGPTIIAFSLNRTRNRWPFAPTGTRRPTRMSWSGSARP
jgi:hypothetical protein